jgi:hypothetical protein
VRARLHCNLGKAWLSFAARSHRCVCWHIDVNRLSSLGKGPQWGNDGPPAVRPRGTKSHEIKHDGFRILARRDAKGVRLFTRNGRTDSTRPPLDFVVGGDPGGADVAKTHWRTR